MDSLKKRFPSLQSLGGDGNTSFLRAARAGNLERVLEHLKNNIDINTSNANGLNALHLASKDGHIHVVAELLKRGAIVDSATKKGNTALHIASLAGQEEVVQLLLQHNASVNVQSQNGFTPLYMAAQENHDSVVKLLLANGANQSLATEDGFTPLAVAMQQGHDKVVAVLLESDTRGKVRLPALHIAAKKDDVKAASLLLENDHNPDVTSKSGFTPLHIASHYGNQAIANLLIQKGADVNYSAKHNISPLHVAAKWGKTNMVSLLLEKGANIEAKTRDGLTPLHCAARSGHEQVVDMLLERGAPISAKTKNGLAPLHMAAQGEHVDAARILLYHRAPVDEVTVDYLTALHVAAHCGHVRVAKLLLDRNADANARALNGFTPLHIACKKNRIKVVELLLRHGASISATTESGLTPLHVAAFMGCMNIVIYLLQHDASPDVPTVRGETPLHLAARANQTDIIRILLRNGAQVDARAREQQTPLHIASRLGNVDIVMLLLQHGAQVDATTKDMYTALHIAAKEGQDEVAAVLIENGAALDAATKKGFTPLHLTAKYGHIKVAQLLLQKEADVDAQGKNGVTPLHVACHYDNQNVALLLLEKGASPHATAKNGHTPLHIAARKNQMDIATTLLEYGAQANAESKAGFTPLHLSCQEGHAEISNLLIEHKASVNHPAKNGLTPMHLCAQEDNVNVAEILEKNGANIDMVTKAGYTPLHVAAHFGQANMVRFLLQHGANVDAATSIGYTPLHQTAQQGHCHIVNLLLEHKANANAQTVNGQTPLHIARKLGYISVLDSLKSITNEEETSPVSQPDEKYRVVAPEAMHETFMSDSEEEGGEDNMLSDQPYRYLTVDEMKSLGDDSLPIDVTRDERVDSNRMTQSAEYGAGGVQQQPITEEIISPHKAQVHGMGKSAVDGIYIGNGLQEEPHAGRKLSWRSFLVSFLVDARGGAMRGCRHSGVRIIIPSRSTCQPTRVTCRYVKPQRTMHPPQLMEGEALASRVLELGPVSTKFIGPIIMEVPHFASLRGKEREIIILRSDNGETWREHTIDNSEDIIHDVMQQCFEPEEIAQLDEQASGNNVCRFVTYDFPQYFAVVSRIRQEVHAIGPEGGMVSSTVVPQVQAVFPQGALTKKIKVGLQAQPVDPDLTAKLLGRGVAVSPIVTVEPRRRKFHKAITLSMPAPKAHSQGMINQYSGNTPTLRLLCSITGGPSRAQWEDVTGSTPLTFVNDCVSFTTTVSARFWLMDCRNISEATKMATELYKEVIHVPFMARFVVFAKKVEPHEARLRVFCMTDDKEDKTLEKQELFTEVAKSRDVEVLEGKPQYIEMAGNLVPVTKSGEQLQLQFKAFRENRLPFTVRVKDQHADIVGRTLFMKEPKVAKGEPPQHPICILNIVLPEVVVPDGAHAFSEKITTSYRTSLYGPSKHQNDHYIGDIRIVDLSNLLGMDWIQLAPEIGISTEEIDEIINQNTDSIARQAQSMIRLFKDKPHYDIHALEDALKIIGREDIMQKCKSGRLSHSRDFDDTDIMKNSESVEELVREESKRIQQINEREEVKYSAEEKEVEESESDEEITKRSVAERREKIVKRLSVERQIPASTQKREIVKEITEIKRKSLIEDKKAIHESEIMMQLPTDNIIKSAIVPEQVIKMKMGKMDSVEISKSDFDNELTQKFKTSGRSSEEEEESREENFKEVQDVTTTEKTTKVTKQIQETSSQSEDTRKLTEDFLNAEKLSQLPTDITVSEKFVEEFKEKTEPVTTTTSKIVGEEKIEDIIDTETSKVEDKSTEYKTISNVLMDSAIIVEAVGIGKVAEPVKLMPRKQSEDEKKPTEVEEKPIEAEKKPSENEKEPRNIITKDEKKTVTTTVTTTTTVEKMPLVTEGDKKIKEDAKHSATAPLIQEEPKITSTDKIKLTHDFLSMEQTTQLPIEKKPIDTDESMSKLTESKEKEGHEPEHAPKEIKQTTSVTTTQEEIKVGTVEGKKLPEDLLSFEVKTQLPTQSSVFQTSDANQQNVIFEKVAMKKHEKMSPIHLLDEIERDSSLEQQTDVFKKMTIKAHEELPTSQHFDKIEKETLKDTLTKSVFDEKREIVDKVGDKIVVSTTEIVTSVLDASSDDIKAKPQTQTKITEQTVTFAPNTEDKSEKISPPLQTVPLDEPSSYTLLERSMDGLDNISDTMQPLDMQKDIETRKITYDFLTMEQKTQIPVRQVEKTDSIIKTVDETPASIEETVQIATATIPPVETRKITADFLTMEQRTQLPVDKLSTGTFELTAPVVQEPRKSLTEVEFYKSIEETITRKMSEGLIDLNDAINQKGDAEIPDSQTPPPTPIETQTNSAEPLRSPKEKYTDTVTTLHTTTQSTLERTSAISTIETLQDNLIDSLQTKEETENVRVLQPIQSQDIAYAGVAASGDYDDDYIEDDDDDDDDDDVDRESITSQPVDSALNVKTNITTIRNEATILVDKVLEESCHIVNEQQQQQQHQLQQHQQQQHHVNGHDAFDLSKQAQTHDYNTSDSDNYAITCDDVDGLDVIKSPTIESMSGKSFDENLSFTDEHFNSHTTNTSTITSSTTNTTTTTTTSNTIVTMQQQQVSTDLPVEVTKTIVTKTVVETQLKAPAALSLKEHDHKASEDASAVRVRRIERKFEKLSSDSKEIDEQADKFDRKFAEIIQDDEISNLQDEFSKLSWDGSVSPTTNTLADIEQTTPDNDIQDLTTETGEEFVKSTESTPVPIPLQTTTTTAPTKPTENIDIPTPKPRTGKVSSPAESELRTQFVTQVEDSTKEETIATTVAPVPKPRAQLKQTESFKNLAALVDQGDNVSLLSLDITDELSKTDEVSTDYSIKSQRFEQPISTATYSEEPIDTFEPTSELSVDDGDTEQSEVLDGKTTSFYIGESSRNVITKTTPTRPEDAVVEPSALEPIDAKDIPLLQEHSVDSDELADQEGIDSFKEFTTMPKEEAELESKITRQGSETRNDLLEHEPDAQSIAVAGTVPDTRVSDLKAESSLTLSEATTSDLSSLDCKVTTSINVVEETEATTTDTTSSANVRPVELDLVPSLDKSELESLEKELSKASSKVVHSPQQPPIKVSAEEVEKTLDEVQQSLKAVNDELRHVVKDGKSIKESPSEFEFRDITSLHSLMDTQTDTSKKFTKEEFSVEFDTHEKDDISTFIGVPESAIEKMSSQAIEEKPYVYDSTIKESLNKAAVMAHYSQDEAPKEDGGSLGFVSRGTTEEYSSMEEHAAKQEHASLGFISTETAEDFSSMEDYYQEKLAKASVITTGSGAQSPSLDSTSGTFKEISSEQTLKPFDAVLHRVKTDSSGGDSTNRWSVPEIDHSSSSDSYYRSFDKTESRPLSSDIENLLTQGNSSEYRTALDASSVCPESTEYASAVSTFDSSSGKTLSSHESMKSLDSETSANLGSIDVSELSETLVASTTDADALDFEDISRLKDLQADDDDDSDDSLEIAHQAFPMTEQQIQQSQMKRSQEMIFKPKAEDIDADIKMETAKIEEYPKPKEVEKTWGLAYPIDATTEEIDKTDDILLYHGESLRTQDDVTKLASSLDEGSILSVSMSSTSNIDTVVENFDDLIGSAGSSVGIEGLTLTQDDHLSLQTEDTFHLELESKEQSPQEGSISTSPDEVKKRGHKRNESTAVSGDALKDIADKEVTLLGEGKESESESDTDPYESEYARQFRSPKDRKSKKKKQAAAEMDHSFETEKRPFTPSQLVAEVIVEDSLTEELEAESAMIEERRPSQNMQDYSNIPDITVTEETQKSPSMEEESDKFPEKSLYKVRTQEELHKATDVPLHQQIHEDESFQHRVQEQYLQKLAELKRAEVGAESDYDENKAPDSPDSFEMVDQPDISDEFVIIEEVAKEANEAELGGQSIKIKPTKYESKHDEEVEKMIIKSAPADPKLGSQLYRDDLNFEFEESPPTAGSGSGSEQQDEVSDIATANKKWVEMQLTDAQLRYPYDLTGGILEDIKEEDGEFEVGSSRISSFKDSFSSTPEYDVLAARRYFARGEHDDISMSSLQEFESLEQAISLENRNRTHQGSTDSSNGSFTRRYIVRHSGSGTAVGGDDISISSLKEFEGLENACIEAHLIEIKAKEEAALLLSRSDESSRSNGSDTGNVVMTKVTRTVTKTNEQILPGQNITEVLKNKLAECDLPGSTVKITEISSELMNNKSKVILDEKLDSDRGSVDSLEINKSLEGMTSSIDSFEISKDATSKSDLESLDQGVQLKTRTESLDSIENEEAEEARKITTVERQDESITTTITTTTTSTDADGREHTVTSVITTTSTSSGDLPMDEMTKDSSIDSLNLCMEQTTSSAGTTATYQTSAGNSQMSGSVTSCASSTLMEDSFPPSMAMSGSTMTGSYWSHDEATVVSGGARDGIDDLSSTEVERKLK